MGQKLHMALMSDRCQSNGNDHLSNFNALRPRACIHMQRNKGNFICCELSHVPGENQRIVLHDKTACPC